MDRSNHYEAAFEAYLRAHGVAYIAVDEAKRSLLGNVGVKSLDFIVVGPDTCKLVVDVKGRKFPGGSAEKPRKVWQNWATLEDVDGLGRWAEQFGTDFRGVIAFVYQIMPPFVLPTETADLFTFRDRVYLMRGVSCADYRRVMRPRSERWGTVHLATADFRTLVVPFSQLLHESSAPIPSENAVSP